MPSTYTQSLRQELQATGENDTTWGDRLNTNLGTILEDAIAGVATITLGNADYELSVRYSEADEARKAILIVRGVADAPRTITVPAVPKVYIVQNLTSGGQAITVKARESSTTVEVVNGEVGIMFCNGSSMVSAASVAKDGTLAPSKISTQASAWTFNGALAVNRVPSIDASYGQFSLDGTAGSRVMLYAAGSLIGGLAVTTSVLNIDSQNKNMTFTTNGVTRILIAPDGSVAVAGRLAANQLASTAGADIGGNLTVAGTSTFTGAATFASTVRAVGLHSTSTLSSDSDIQGGRDLSLTRNLSVGGSASVGNDLAVVDAISCATLTATTNITLSSDERLKYDWRVLPSTFIADMAQVQSGLYTRKGTKQRQAGVTAQSLQNVLPEAVHQGERYMSVEYANAAMVTAIELCKKVVALEARIAELEVAK